MALNAGLATSKVLLILGATIAGSILVKNGRMGDFVNDTYKVIVKHLKNEDGSTFQKNSVDPKLLAEINLLRQRLSEIASEKASITFVTGSKSTDTLIGSIIFTTVPVFLIGAAGFGYIRWKGISLSDFMYVTKRSMANAVSSMSKQLEQLQTALTATKRTLTSRLEHLSSGMDQNMELQSELKTEVSGVRGDVARYGLEIETVQRLVQTLGVKIETIENKQDIANCGVIYLCNCVGMQKNQLGGILQGLNKPQLEIKHLPRLEHSSSSVCDTGFKDLAVESMELRTEIKGSAGDEAGTSSSDKGSNPRLQRFFSGNLT